MPTLKETRTEESLQLSALIIGEKHHGADARRKGTEVILTLTLRRALPSPAPARSVGQTPAEGDDPSHVNSTHEGVVNQILRR